MAPDGAGRRGGEAARGGFRAVKLRLGYPTLREDLAALHAVRKRLGDGIAIMVDYNQALSVDEALERGRALDQENIVWLEEPIRHDDYAGLRQLARELKMPVQIGENFSLPAGDGRRRSPPSACDLRDARPRADRRRHRLAARRGARRRRSACRCRRIFIRRSARICWRRRRPRTGWNTSIGPTRSCSEPLEIVDGHAVVPRAAGQRRRLERGGGRALPRLARRCEVAHFVAATKLPTRLPRLRRTRSSPESTK